MIRSLPAVLLAAVLLAACAEGTPFGAPPPGPVGGPPPPGTVGDPTDVAPAPVVPVDPFGAPEPGRLGDPFL